LLQHHNFGIFSQNSKRENDISIMNSNSSSILIQYADDITAIVKAKTSNNFKVELSRSLLELTDWFNVNGLQIA
jgi:hypothetical protein